MDHVVPFSTSIRNVPARDSIFTEQFSNHVVYQSIFVSQRVNDVRMARACTPSTNIFLRNSIDQLDTSLATIGPAPLIGLDFRSPVPQDGRWRATAARRGRFLVPPRYFSSQTTCIYSRPCDPLSNFCQLRHCPFT
jgi:hypothetical protein